MVFVGGIQIRHARRFRQNHLFSAGDKTTVSQNHRFSNFGRICASTRTAKFDPTSGSTSVPTSGPTKAPTRAPTRVPTRAPTNVHFLRPKMWRKIARCPGGEKSVQSCHVSPWLSWFFFGLDILSIGAPPDPKWNWPYPLCSQRLILLALVYHQLLPSEVLVCFQSLQASAHYVSFPASIWPHPMHKHLENLSVPWSRLATGPSACLRWLWLACEMRSKVKCVHEKSPSFSEFSFRILLRIFPEFSRIFRALLPGKRRPQKFHQKIPAIFQCQIPWQTQRKNSQKFSGERAN